jgi:hypothetical protein
VINSFGIQQDVREILAPDKLRAVVSVPQAITTTCT